MIATSPPPEAPIPKSILFISPRPERLNYYSLDVMETRGYKPVTMFGDLSIVTAAAMADAHLDVAVCDQAFQTVDFDHPADIIGITGKITQFTNMVAIAEEFRARGKTIVIGGPLASLSPDWVRPHCDILVRGEIEEISDQIFADLAAGTTKDEYVGGQPDITSTPIPRWDLLKSDRVMGGAVQTSRGCPFECEFCDVIVYNGRKQRHKTPAQIIAELDVVYSHGYRTTLLADDNLTVSTQRAKELMSAVKAWNLKQTEGHMRFGTQLSIDICRDEELVRLCAEAGLTTMFIGIETPNADSLKETGKRQNLKRSLLDDIDLLFAHGVMVRGGMIVGFDADGPDIFERQLEFAQQSCVPIFSCGALMAPDGTPLQERLRAAGRLKKEGHGTSGNVFETNIIHPTLSQEQLIAGLKWLVNNLYSVENFGARIHGFLAKMGEPLDPDTRKPRRFIDQRRNLREAVQMVNRWATIGPEEEKLWKGLVEIGEAHYNRVPFIYETMFSYLQVRSMLEAGDYWEPHLRGKACPI